MTGKVGPAGGLCGARTRNVLASWESANIHQGVRQMSGTCGRCIRKATAPPIGESTCGALWGEGTCGALWRFMNTRRMGALDQLRLANAQRT